jgi:hypothetical protein
MKSYIIILALCAFHVLAITYNELSVKYTKAAYSKINLDDLNENSNPGDLGPLRKSILLTRTYLDIFVYSYPTGTSLSNPDIFEILRSDLNKGYTLIGNFDDLHFVNYTSSDKQKLLGKCLDWKSVFASDIGTCNFGKYLSASGSKLYYRNKTELSTDFWGLIPEVPELNLTGYQNIALLSTGQINNCITNFHIIVKLEEIWKDEYHEQFHDYRKLIRGINFIPNYFPEAYKINVGKYTDILQDAYNSFGKLNDIINEYSYYEKKGDSKIASQKRDQVISMWHDLRSWMGTEDIVYVLTQVGNSTVLI